MNGIERIATERNRQIKDHGFTEKHDNCHYEGDLAKAAACYAAYSAGLRILVYDERN